MKTNNDALSVSLTLHIDEESEWVIGRFRCFSLLNLPCYIFLDGQDKLVEWVFPTLSSNKDRDIVSVFEKRPIKERGYLALYYGHRYYYFDPNNSDCSALSWHDETGAKIYSFPEEKRRYAYKYSIGGKEYAGGSLVRFRPNNRNKGLDFFDLNSREIVGFLYEGERIYHFDKGKHLSDSLLALCHNRRIWAIYNLQTRKAVVFETGKDDQTFTRIRHIKSGFKIVPDPLGYEGSGRPILLEIRHNLVWGLYDAETGKMIVKLDWIEGRQGRSKKGQ